MTTQPKRKTGQRSRRGRELRRLVRDRKIFAKLRLLATEGERRHAMFEEPVEALSVFLGKEDRPASWELSPFPMGNQDNGKPMPQWKDLSQWLKVTMATIVCNEWDLLTFNINLHPDLEAELVLAGSIRPRLAERVRKHVSRALGAGREYFFVIEAHSARSAAPTRLHVHGAIALRDVAEAATIKDVLAKAFGHDVHGRQRMRRAVHTEMFYKMQAAYPNYLFKFRTRRDPRLDERRLVMSRAMTQAASMFWADISRGVEV